ncbi:MAG: aminotransferase class III-fold pyridoxal phosphate-dependent enzyme, partial [Candidatus Hydrogenedens sp.]
MAILHPNENKGNYYRDLWTRYVGRGQQTYTPSQIVVDRAQGVYLWTVDGRRLIDFTSGVLVSNLGYAHPKFETKFNEYYKRLPRNTYNMISPVQVESSKRLIESFGYSKAQKILWAASGSEGIQKAMWSALHRYPERYIIVATRHGFHGKKGLAADVTGDTSPNPNVRWISFPMGEGHEQNFYENELNQLWDTHKEKIALLITEPYLGAKGSYHPPKWYHQLLQKWCNEHDIPFIFDEVQSCFGRTGNMYAFQTYGVEPDLVVLGKGMASGEPASAVVGREDLIESLDYGEASDTFSGGSSA